MMRRPTLWNFKKSLAIGSQRSNGLAFAFYVAMDFPILIQRVRAEFDEMPGLRLTPAQAARLLGLDHRSCERVISVLVRSAFLRWTSDGSVVRAES
jgi:hypothetical protein